MHINVLSVNNLIHKEMKKIFAILGNDEDTYQNIVEYLKITDKDYDIPMSMLVNLEDYAQKIVSRAVTVAALENDEIIAMANFYCNDTESKIAYVTNISISRFAQGKGYHFKDLLYAVLKIAQKAGMKKLAAETTDRRVLILHKRTGAIELKREEIDGVIHYYNCIENISDWLEKNHSDEISIVNINEYNYE